MKTIIILIVIFVLVLVGAALFGRSLGSNNLPRRVQRFYDAGYVCYIWPDGSGDCYKME